METVAVIALAALSAILSIVCIVLVMAWVKLNNKYKEHLLLWGDLLSMWEEASAQLARISNKERVLMYAAEEAGQVAHIAGVMLRAMVIASAQIGDASIAIQTEKIVQKPSAQTVAEDD
jgi:hypothetical protein